ncbi:MAG: glycosyltransferase family 2 protein, partial [Candidatus Altiarchaeales archaeon]|nr:glycosyltransferase family 2 protein [Candidatus Altiarchaeales archaeon]
MESNRNIDVSFVIIARNEEKNIGRCIKSVLDAAEDIDFEVIVVDSASIDRTREIAGRYPAKIVELSGNNRPTASAGRYVGSLYAKGKYIFFVDGDMILDPGFLPHAIKYLSKNSNVAVSGWITQGDTLDPYLKTIGD